jgi:hypothetical protein
MAKECTEFGKVSRVVAGVREEIGRPLPILWDKWQYGRAEKIL